jgi:inner membrane protein
MASAFTHAAVALAIGTAFRAPGPPARFWALGAICATLPDLDVIGFRFGVPYDHMFGHRGFTHSVFFALLLAVLLVPLAFSGHEWDGRRASLVAFLVLATASHGVLDALTDGGGGVAFLAPFTDARWVFPWRPIEVSPIGIRRFFTARGASVLMSELRWVLLPAAVFAAACIAARRSSTR